MWLFSFLIPLIIALSILVIDSLRRNNKNVGLKVGLLLVFAIILGLSLALGAYFIQEGVK